MVVMEFSFVFLFRKKLYSYVNVDHVPIRTLKKYMELHMRHVKSKISNIVPEKFALVLDGWCYCDGHIGIHATLQYAGKGGFSPCLFWFLPLKKSVVLMRKKTSTRSSLPWSFFERALTMYSQLYVIPVPQTNLSFIFSVFNLLVAIDIKNILEF